MGVIHYVRNHCTIIITSECRALWGEPEQAIVDVGDDCLRVTNRYSGAGVPA